MKPKANMAEVLDASEQTALPSLKDQLHQLTQENRTLKERIEKLEGEAITRQSEFLDVKRNLQEVKEEKRKWEDKAEKWEDKAEQWEEKCDTWFGDAEKWKGEADMWKSEAKKWRNEFEVIRTAAAARAFPVRLNRPEVESEELKPATPRFASRGPPDDRARREVRFEDPFYY